MKKWFVCLLLASLISSNALAKETRKLKKPSPAPVKKEQKISPQKEAPFQALLVIEANTGMVLEAVNPHLKHPLASVTKLMTACIVMEKLESGANQLTDIISISSAASKMGGSQVYLKQGESFTLEELMKAIIIASGNDAAYAVAEHISGTVEAFVEEMNKKAKSLGMNDSEFHSVHGLPPDPGQSQDISSCNDLMLLSRELLKYPKLLEWTAIQTEPFRNGTFIMRNHNKIIAKLPGTDGFKTGYYEKAGFNVVATARKDGLRLIVAVLGSPSARIRDSIAIEKFKNYMAKYKMAALAQKGQNIGEAVFLPDGETQSLQAVAASDFSFPVLREKMDAVKKEIRLPREVEGGVEAGQKMGDMVFMLDNETLGTIDLISPAQIKKVGFLKKILRLIGLG
ncbi:MAG: D-alanyl-D-alanine carboxypeptidase [Proteobacteria bacterium]|nr:D-alanyl-D-alanine carboxypeptidase [Desulfobacula sp.]MBU4129600.1 D-alanyl-D-alanine carboxypeptidase [Pseudomonadota bacterium]